MARRTSPASEARIGGLVDPGRGPALAERRVAAHQVDTDGDQAVVITLASTAICVPAAPAKAAAVGTTQNPAFGLAAQASSEPCAGAASSREASSRAQEHPIPGGQAEWAQQLTDRRQPPRRDQ